jgi:hypothetical protein
LAILKDYPDLEIELSSIVQQLSPEMQLYKNLLPIRELLLTTLESLQNSV